MEEEQRFVSGGKHFALKDVLEIKKIEARRFYDKTGEFFEKGHMFYMDVLFLFWCQTLPVICCRFH